MKPTSQIVSEGITRYRETIRALESKLAVAILYGSGYAVIMTEPYPTGNGTFDRCLARVNPVSRAYEANAAPCFPSLDLMGDHFCGICLFEPDRADQLVADLTEGKGGFAIGAPKGATFSKRHIRQIETDRLTRAREMLAILEGIAAKEGIAL